MLCKITIFIESAKQFRQFFYYPAGTPGILVSGRNK
jgi:hypothetical protein